MSKQMKNRAQLDVRGFEELGGLNEEAVALVTQITRNFEELGI